MKEVKRVAVYAICDFCGGEMKYQAPREQGILTYFVEFGYSHKCLGCGRVEILKKKYPVGVTIPE